MRMEKNIRSLTGFIAAALLSLGMPGISGNNTFARGLEADDHQDIDISIDLDGVIDDENGEISFSVCNEYAGIAYVWIEVLSDGITSRYSVKVDDETQHEISDSEGHFPAEDEMMIAEIPMIEDASMIEIDQMDNWEVVKAEENIVSGISGKIPGYAEDNLAVVLDFMDTKGNYYSYQKDFHIPDEDTAGNIEGGTEESTTEIIEGNTEENAEENASVHIEADTGEKTSENAAVNIEADTGEKTSENASANIEENAGENAAADIEGDTEENAGENAAANIEGNTEDNTDENVTVNIEGNTEEDNEGYTEGGTEGNIEENIEGDTEEYTAENTEDNNKEESGPDTETADETYQPYQTEDLEYAGVNEIAEEEYPSEISEFAYVTESEYEEDPAEEVQDEKGLAEEVQDENGLDVVRQDENSLYEKSLDAESMDEEDVIDEQELAGLPEFADTQELTYSEENTDETQPEELQNPVDYTDSIGYTESDEYPEPVEYPESDEYPEPVEYPESDEYLESVEYLELTEYPDSADMSVNIDVKAAAEEGLIDESKSAEIQLSAEMQDRTSGSESAAEKELAARKTPSEISGITEISWDKSEHADEMELPGKEILSEQPKLMDPSELTDEKNAECISDIMDKPVLQDEKDIPYEEPDISEPDMTAPLILSCPEADDEENTRKLRIKDNVNLKEVEIYIGDEKVDYQSEGELFSFHIPESPASGNVRVVATDSSGNTYERILENYISKEAGNARLKNKSSSLNAVMLLAAAALLPAVVFVVNARIKKDRKNGSRQGR